MAREGARLTMTRRTSTLSAEAIGKETPLRLDVAANLAFWRIVR